VASGAYDTLYQVDIVTGIVTINNLADCYEKENRSEYIPKEITQKPVSSIAKPKTDRKARIKAYTKNMGKNNNSWTAFELEKLMAMVNDQKQTVKQASKKLGRTTSACVRVLNRMKEKGIT